MVAGRQLAVAPALGHVDAEAVADMNHARDGLGVPMPILAETIGGEAGEARRDLATAVTSVLAAQAGAWAVRVHEVIASRDALRVAAAWQDGADG